MNAVLSVIGHDTVGILASVSTKCSSYKANIIEVSQTVMDSYFCMIMLVNVDELSIEFTDFVDEMKKLGKEKALEINVMHEDLFNSMHKI